jgi:hypothetical protein
MLLAQQLSGFMQNEPVEREDQYQYALRRQGKPQQKGHLLRMVYTLALPPTSHFAGETPGEGGD